MVDNKFDEFYGFIIIEIDQYPLGSALIDTAGKILHCNDKFCSVFKYDRFELTDSNVRMLVPASSRPHHDKFVKNFFDSYTPESKHVIINQFGVNKYDQTSKMIDFEVDDSKSVLPVIKFNSTFILVYNVVLWVVMLLFLFYWPYLVLQSVDTDISNLQLLQLVNLVDIAVTLNQESIDPENNKTCSERKLIFVAYLKSYLLLDIIISIPVYLYTGLFNLNNLKTGSTFTSTSTSDSKYNLNGLLLFIILAKFLKLNQTYKSIQSSFNKIYNKNNKRILYLLNLLQEHDTVKRLIKIALYYIVLCHYTVCIYIYVNIQHPSLSPKSWFTNSRYASENVYQRKQDYFAQLIAEYLSMTFGFNMIEYYSHVDRVFSFFWMLVSSITFCILIATVCKILILHNESELVFNQSLNVVDSLNLEYDSIGQETTENVIMQLYKNKHLMQNKSIVNLKGFLSDDIYYELLKELYSGLMDEFKLFSTLSMDVVQLLALNSVKSNITILFKINSKVENVFFITKGSVSMLDSNMNQLSDYEADDIIGLKEFEENTLLKYSLSCTPEDKVNTIYKFFCNYKLSFEVKREKPMKSINDNRSMNYSVGKSSTGANTMKKIQKYENYAIASTGSEYYTIDYQNLEDIFLKDPKTYLSMVKYNLDQKAVITSVDYTYTQELLDEFESREDPGVVCLKNGEIYRANLTFRKMFELDNESEDKFNIFNMLTDKEYAKTDSFNNIKGSMLFKWKKRDFEVMVTKSLKRIVVKLEKVRNGKIILTDLKNDSYFIVIRFNFGKGETIKRDNVLTLNIYTYNLLGQPKDKNKENSKSDRKKKKKKNKDENKEDKESNAEKEKEKEKGNNGEYEALSGIEANKSNLQRNSILQDVFD